MIKINISNIPKHISYPQVINKLEKFFNLKKNKLNLVYKLGNTNGLVFLKSDTENVFKEFLTMESLKNIENGESEKESDENKALKYESDQNKSNSEMNGENNEIQKLDKKGKNFGDEFSGEKEDENNEIQKLDKKSEKSYVDLFHEYLNKNPIKIKKNILKMRIFFDLPEKKNVENKISFNPIKIEEIDIRDIVTPLWKESYSNQLIIKKNILDKFLLQNNLINSSNEILDSSFEKNSLLRNSMEFAIGFTSDEKGSLGFRGTSFMNNQNLVFDPICILFINENLKRKIQFINEELNKKSYLIYDRITKKGYLRMLKLKINTSNEYIAVLDINHLDKIDILDQNISLDKINFLKLFKNGENLFDFINMLPFENIQITLNNSQFEGFRPNNIFEFRGKKTILQKVNDFTFNLSAFGFFQCNVSILEKIIDKISQNFLKENKILLDLCCGQMTLGILLSKYFKFIFGVENNKSSFEDFKKVIEINDIKNCKFISEDINKFSIENIFHEIQIESKCTAILDPPRAGVNQKVIQRIRKLNEINEIFFISCDYKQSLNNIIGLTRPESNNYPNEPFKIKNVWGFDMFVGTKKIEVLYHLRRTEK